MQVQLINLDRSLDRLARFRAVNAHLSDVRRVHAIDGLGLDRAALVAGGLIREPLPYSPGALGVALTHCQLWERCREGGAPLTVSEDDALFNGGFERAGEQLLAGLPAAWDIVLWGWNFDADLSFDMLPGISPCIARFDPGLGGGGADGFRDQPVAPRLYRLWRAWGALAYTVSPAGAAKLLQACLPLQPITIAFPDLGRTMPNLGIDILMSGAYPGLDAYVCFPPLAITRNDLSQSTIQGVGAGAAQA